MMMMMMMMMINARQMEREGYGGIVGVARELGSQ
jgi:hypothetical protein